MGQLGKPTPHEPAAWRKSLCSFNTLKQEILQFVSWQAAALRKSLATSHTTKDCHCSSHQLKYKFHNCSYSHRFCLFSLFCMTESWLYEEKLYHLHWDPSCTWYGNHGKCESVLLSLWLGEAIINICMPVLYFSSYKSWKTVIWLPLPSLLFYAKPELKTIW